MLKKFLKEVVSIVVGKSAEDIVDLLDTKKYVNEFIISKKLGLTINQTRNILYRISDHGLVSSTRKKDKRKGWYTYFWKIEALKSLEFLRNDIQKKVGQLEGQISSRETKRFYVCETCHIEMTEENALAVDFTCNECGSVFVLKDNSRVVREMKKSLDRLKNDLELVEVEIEKESKKVEAVKLKTIKKEAAEKKKADDIKKAARKVARQKAAADKEKNKPSKASKKASTTRKSASKKTAKKKVAKKTVKKKTAKTSTARKRTSKKATNN